MRKRERVLSIEETIVVLTAIEEERKRNGAYIARAAQSIERAMYVRRDALLQSAQQRLENQPLAHAALTASDAPGT